METTDTRTIAEVDAQIKAENALTATTNEAADTVPREKFDALLAKEHALSEAYVRLREIVGAIDPPTLTDPQVLWAYVESVARRAVAANEAAARPITTVMGLPVYEAAAGGRVPDGWFTPDGDPDTGVTGELTFERVNGESVPLYRDALATQPVQAQGEAAQAQRPEWAEGVPTNLQAAAADADEWLALIQRLNDAGRWRFSESDSRAKLDGCRAALNLMMSAPAVDRGLSGVQLRYQVESTLTAEADYASAFHGNAQVVLVESVLSALAASAPSQAERIAELEAELDDKDAEIEEARRAPWPEWAKTILKLCREVSGYDGYHDQDQGVDLPEEVRENFAELQAEIERLKAKAPSQAEPAEVPHLYQHALTELQLLGYTVEDGELRPPESGIPVPQRPTPARAGNLHEKPIHCSYMGMICASNCDPGQCIERPSHAGSCQASAADELVKRLKFLRIVTDDFNLKQIRLIASDVFAVAAPPAGRTLTDKCPHVGQCHPGHCPCAASSTTAGERE